MTSIQKKLLLWLLAGLFLSTLVTALAVYTRARAEARELFDYQLQLMAMTFPYGGLGAVTAPPQDETDSRDVMIVQIWDESGAQVYLSRPGPSLPESLDIGFSTVGTRNGNWRVYNALVGSNIVQVAQPTRAREELAAGLALRTMLPLLLLLPVVVTLVWITVGQGLKPLNEVALAVSKRSADALDPLPHHHLPGEVQPLVNALNDLLERLNRASNAQKSFIADAAHELRTPLTAVQLQIQLAERATTDAERAAAFAQLKGGTERAAHLVQQLLTLARNEPEAREQSFATVNLTDIARDTVAELAPIAEAKNIDLGLTSTETTSVMGNADALRVLLGNLVDNAIRYTPSGGTIDVAVNKTEGQASLMVTDTGPGIPPAERGRVFDRFYRHDPGGVSGSGLGLAIVRRIAEQHAATVELGEREAGTGLKVTVRFPV